MSSAGLFALMDKGWRQPQLGYKQPSIVDQKLLN
jgi:hypothetical protein